MRFSSSTTAWALPDGLDGKQHISLASCPGGEAARLHAQARCFATGPGSSRVLEVSSFGGTEGQREGLSLLIAGELRLDLSPLLSLQVEAG